jgi:O-antigen/teichoic acid export membrane protein
VTERPHTSDLDQLNGDRLSGTEVRNRASAGLFYVASTGGLLLAVGFVGNLVLARLLTPRDFGLIALGATVISLATTLADGGLAAALIRREEKPKTHELRTLTGIQLAITSTVSVIAVAIALQFGEAGMIASVMIVSLPLSSFQIAGRVVLIRELAFAKTSLTDALALVAFYVWSITTAVLGAGAWSMATGTVVRALVATIALVALSPVGWLWPSIRRFRELMPAVRFGLRFQLAWIIYVAREQLANVGTAAIAGVSVLGEWSLASRLMQLPLLLFQSVWQVSYPAMSHVLAGGEDAKPILEKAARIAGVAAVLILAPFAAATPELIPLVFGTQWHDAASVLPLTCLGLLLLGPVSVAAAGYLNAANRPGDPLRAVAWATGAMLPISLGLLPVIGIFALGLGWVVSGAVEAAVLAHYVRRSCGARLVARVAAPTLVGAVAGVAGVLAGEASQSPLVSSIAAAGIAFGVGLSGLLLVCRGDVFATAAVVQRSVRQVVMPLVRRAPSA